MLQAAEPGTDVTFTNLGIVDWKQATAEEDAAAAPSPRRFKRPALWLIALLAGLGLLLIIEVVAAIVLGAMVGR